MEGLDDMDMNEIKNLLNSSLSPSKILNRPDISIDQSKYLKNNSHLGSPKMTVSL